MDITTMDTWISALPRCSSPWLCDPTPDPLIQGGPYARPDGPQRAPVGPEGARPEGAKPEGAKPEGAKPEGARPEVQRPEEGHEVLRRMVGRIDPMAKTLYSRECMRDAVRTLVERLMAFLSEPAVAKAFGPQKTWAALVSLQSASHGTHKQVRALQTLEAFVFGLA